MNDTQLLVHIDSQSQRRYALQELLVRINGLEYLSVWPVHTVDAVEEIQAEEVGAFLIHWNDVANPANVENQVRNPKLHESVFRLIDSSRVVIGYTGGEGGLDTNVLRKAAKKNNFSNVDYWFAINRKVESVADSQEELKELGEWLVTKLRENALASIKNELPLLIRPLEVPQHLHSLRILLEIFIVCNADVLSADAYSRCDEVTKVLLRDRSKIIRNDLVSSWIRSLSNWSHVFQGELTTKIARELSQRDGDFIALESILQKIASQASEALALEEACHLYEAIAKELKR